MEQPPKPIQTAITQTLRDLAKAEGEINKLRWIIQQVLGMLPMHRDWLDPAVEKEMRAAVKK